MAGVHTRALTAARPIKPTSPRCHSAWQPNPGRGSTYRRGKSVQTIGTSCMLWNMVTSEANVVPNLCVVVVKLTNALDECIDVWRTDFFKRVVGNIQTDDNGQQVLRVTPLHGSLPLSHSVSLPPVHPRCLGEITAVCPKPCLTPNDRFGSCVTIIASPNGAA